MRIGLRKVAAVLVLCIGALASAAQSAPPSSAQVWHSKDENSLTAPHAVTTYAIDPAKIYTLAELVDLAEQHNPETRVAWQQAKARASALGVARSALYPTMAALAVANTSRVRVLLNSAFYRQTYGSVSPELHSTTSFSTLESAAARSMKRRPTCWPPILRLTTHISKSSSPSRRRTTGC